VQYIYLKAIWCQWNCCRLSRYDSEACLISSSSLNLVLLAQAVVKDIGLE